jgi:hypothetical protein
MDTIAMVILVDFGKYLVSFFNKFENFMLIVAYGVKFRFGFDLTGGELEIIN